MTFTRIFKCDLLSASRIDICHVSNMLCFMCFCFSKESSLSSPKGSAPWLPLSIDVNPTTAEKQKLIYKSYYVAAAVLMLVHRCNVQYQLTDSSNSWYLCSGRPEKKDVFLSLNIFRLELLFSLWQVIVLN